jgi:hypothetical protein
MRKEAVRNGERIAFGMAAKRIDIVITAELMVWPPAQSAMTAKCQSQQENEMEHQSAK